MYNTSKVFELFFGMNRLSSGMLSILGHDTDDGAFIMGIDNASSLNNGELLKGTGGNPGHINLFVDAGLQHENIRASQPTIGASIHEGSSGMAVVSITMDTVGDRSSIGVSIDDNGVTSISMIGSHGAGITGTSMIA